MTGSAAPDDEIRRYMGNLQPRGFPGLPEGWTSEFETFPASDRKVQLFAAVHRAPPAERPDRAPSDAAGADRRGGGPRALVVSHGLGEHGGRYLHFPHYLRGAVDVVYCLDHRGHGRSEGLRGYAERFELLSDDLALAVGRLDAQLRRRFGRSEIHLLGHSLGSMIALVCAREHPELPIASLTLSSPMIDIRVKVPFVKRASARGLSMAWGSLQLDNELDPKDLSHDPAVAEAYARDRLVHSKITPRLFTGMQSAMQKARDEWKTGPKAPVFMVVPLDDRITDADAAQAFYGALEHPRKAMKTYPGFFHESFNEIEKDWPFEDLRQWITENSTGS